MTAIYEGPLSRRWPDDFKEGWTAEVIRDAYGTRRLLIGCRTPNKGPRFLVTAFTYTPVERGTIIDAPALLTETREEQADRIGEVTGFLQAIVDAAWDEGMRPSQYRDATQEIAAMRYHLEDMRALAFQRAAPEREDGQ